MAAGAIFLGVLVGLLVLCAILGALCHCQDGSAKVGGGGEGVSSAAGKQEALLNKNKENADVIVVVPHQPGAGADDGQRQRGPEPGEGDVDLCAICKARLAVADAGWGPRRRLRPCGHEYHAACIGLWLQRKRVCPVCRADVAVSWYEILDAMV